MTKNHKNYARADAALVFVAFLDKLAAKVWQRYGKEMCELRYGQPRYVGDSRDHQPDSIDDELPF